MEQGKVQLRRVSVIAFSTLNIRKKIFAKKGITKISKQFYTSQAYVTLISNRTGISYQPDVHNKAIKGN